MLTDYRATLTASDWMRRRTKLLPPRQRRNLAELLHGAAINPHRQHDRRAGYRDALAFDLAVAPVDIPLQRLLNGRVPGERRLNCCNSLPRPHKRGRDSACYLFWDILELLRDPRDRSLVDFRPDKSGQAFPAGFT